MNFTAKNLTHETKKKVLKTIEQNIHILEGPDMADMA